MYMIIPTSSPIDAAGITLKADSVEMDAQTGRVVFKLGEQVVGAFYNINFYKIEA